MNAERKYALMDCEYLPTCLEELKNDYPCPRHKKDCPDRKFEESLKQNRGVAK